MNKQRYTNLEVLSIIVSAWNLSMVDGNVICAKSNNDVDENMLGLMSFIFGREVSADEVYLPDNDYANYAVEYYEAFKRNSKDIKFKKWKSLKRNVLVRTYGVVFDIYLSNGYKTDFLKRMPFLKLTERQFAKIFIRLKHIINN